MDTSNLSTKCSAITALLQFLIVTYKYPDTAPVLRKNLSHPHRLKLVVVSADIRNKETIFSTKPIQITGHVTTVLAMTINLAIFGGDKKSFDVMLRNLWT